MTPEQLAALLTLLADLRLQISLLHNEIAELQGKAEAE